MEPNKFYTEEYNHWKLSFLRVLAVSLFVLLTIILATRTLFTNTYTITDLVLVILIVCHAAVYYLAKIGYLQSGSVALTIISYLSISYMIYHGKGIYDSAVPAYVALIIITFMLLGRKYAFPVLALSIAWLIVLGYLMQTGVLVYPEIDTISNYIRDVMVVFILVYVLSNSYIKQINANIRRVSGELEQRAKAEKAIKEKEAYYRTIFEQASEGILITDEKGIILTSNENMVTISKYRTDELHNQHIDMLLQSGISNQLNSLNADSQQVISHNTHLKCKDKSVAPVEIRSKKLFDGRYQLFVSDISERRKEEKSLRNFERIFSLSANPICIVAENSTLIKVNPALENILGYSQKELLGTRLLDYVHPDEKKAAYNDLAQKVAQRASQINAERRYLTKLGETVWISWHGQPIYDENIGFMVGHDMTEKKRIEQELIEAKEKAEESDRLKTSFLENMSHEIRTPMNGIIGFSDMLKNRNLHVEDREKYCNIILKSGQNLLTIVNDILDISRIETGIIEIQKGPVNINELCAELEDIFMQKANDTNINLVFEKDERVNQEIITDRIRLQQILSNLLTNAFKFTLKGEIRMGCKVKGTMIEFFVRDTGIGIESKMQTKIFERFIQIEPKTTKRNRGTGLGLPISKNLIELLGGKIWLESSPGKGSTFYFNIPYEPAKDLPAMKVTKTPTEKNTSGVILVVEDDIPNYQYLLTILKSAGFEVIHVEDGEKAVKTVETRKDIDLILMDIKLPKMNGYEATRRIKAIHPELPVIAQTAFAMLQDSQKALDAGCDDYISKPLLKKELLQLVEKHLN